MSRTAIDSIIQEFGTSVGAPDMAFDEDGYLAFTSAEGVLLNVDYFEADESLVVYTTIGEIFDDFRFQLYDEMLKANLFWELTLGATLCVDPEGTHALLTASVATTDLDLPKLTNVFEHVNRLALIWAERLRKVAAESDAGTDDAVPPADAPAERDPHPFV